MRSRLELAHSWSAFTGYLILAGIPLLIALPSSARVDELVTPRLSMGSVFLVIATVLFAAYSLSFGLKGGTIKSVLAHVLFLLVLSLPYWTVFTGIVGHGLDRLLGALGYLGLYGACWALLGVPIGRRWPTEIAQFHIKYALLILAFVTTFFVLQPLNPILMLSLWFGEGPLYEQRGFLLMGYLSLAIILGILVWWTAREEDRARVRDAPR
jgi:hypothetical protein